MEGLERLQTQVLEMNDYNVSTIFDYLKTRTNLYEKFNNEEKSIQQMYDFICKKAKEKSKNNVAMINDNVVYLWAVMYFNKSNNELGIVSKNETSKNTKTAKESTIKENDNEIKDNQQNTNQISMFEEVKDGIY